MRLLVAVILLSINPVLLADGDGVQNDEVNVLELIKTEQVDVQAKFETELYDLTEEETERVAVLRIADRPFGAENLSPLELLGKYAVSESEREDYARRYLHVAAENTVKSNAWALTIEKMSREKDYIGEAIAANPSVERMLRELNIDLGGFNKSDFAPALGVISPTRTVTLFTTLDCDACDQAFRQLHRDIKSTALDQVNVVFVGSVIEDQDDIFDWARSVSILKKELEAESIVLHIDGDQWKQVRDGDDVPQVIRNTG